MGAARLLLGMALIASACGPAQTPPGAQEPETSVAIQRPDAAHPEPRSDLPTEQRTPDLFGTWLIETVAKSGAGPRERYSDMILLVGNRQLEVLSQCVTIGPFDYARTAGGGIVISQPEVRPRPPSAAPAPAPVQCARALSPAEQALAPILLAARTVTPGRGGTVALAGQAGTVAMRRPAGALANPRGQAPPPRTPPLLGTWQLVALDGRPLIADERIELLLRPGRIEWRSGCVNETRTLSRDRDSLILGEVDPFPVCERGRSPAERALETLLSAALKARTSADGRLTLQGSGVIAELAPLTR